MDIGGIRPGAGSLPVRPGARMRRTGRLVFVAGLAVALFAAGGLGLWLHTQSPPAAVAALSGGASTAALREDPVLASSSLAQAITSLQARIKAIPRNWN